MSTLTRMLWTFEAPPSDSPEGSVRPVLPVGALRGRILGQRRRFELGSGEFGLLRFGHGDGGRLEGERLRQVGTFGFEEGALQIVEGDFAGLELTHDGVGELCLDHGGRRHERGGRHGVEGIDQVVVVSGRLGAGDLEIAEDLLEPVQRHQDQADGGAAHRHAVAELAHQRLGCMRQRFQARKAEEAARALDRVDEAENVPQDRLVVGVLLEADEFGVHRVEMLCALGQKLTQQVIH